MADPIYLVQGDNGPDIKVTLTREDTGEAEDLSGASVKMHFRSKNLNKILFSLTGSNTTQEAQAGIAVFSFTGSQLDLSPGEYQGEVEVIFDSGQRETVYQIIEFFIREDFA